MAVTIYFRSQAIGDLMKIALIFINVICQKLALDEKILILNLLHFIQANAKTVIMVLFAIYVLMAMGKLVSINAKNV